MAALFGGGGRGAQPSPLPVVPNRSDTEIQNEADRERDQFYSASGGRAVTMLTGGLGVTRQPSSAVVRLLGGVGRT